MTFGQAMVSQITEPKAQVTKEKKIDKLDMSKFKTLKNFKTFMLK